jgi:hypothetical protein
VLCLDDHDRTQVTGGFGRKLTAGAVVCYRDNWVKRVKIVLEEADKIAIGRMSGEPVAGAVTSTSAEVDSAGDIEWKRPSEVMLKAYIRHLPDLRRAAYENARPEWDSGVNARMKIATRSVSDIFERVLVHLASWYPPKHFGGKEADRYFSEFNANRTFWHLDALSPHGQGGHGTGLALDVAGNVLTDLESAIVEMVFALAGTSIVFRDPTRPDRTFAWFLRRAQFSRPGGHSSEIASGRPHGKDRSVAGIATDRANGCRLDNHHPPEAFARCWQQRANQ